MIEWKKFGEQKPERGTYCFVKVITGNVYHFTYFGDDKWNGVLASEDHLWIFESELAATAKPGAKLYTRDEVDAATMKAYFEGQADGEFCFNEDEL